MDDRPKAFASNAKHAVALLLTFTAGFTDIVAYVSVYHSFVAHMTGTTVHMGNDMVKRNWPALIKAGVILLSFVSGSIAGRAIIEAASRRHRPRAATVTLLIEASLVLGFIWIARSHLTFGAFSPELFITCLLVALLAAAMGLQTATLTRIGPLTIHTTFVTGMLNKLAQSVSEWFFWLHDSWHEHVSVGSFLQNSRGHAAFRNAQFMAAIWFTYMAGAVLGTWTEVLWAVNSLYVPVILLLLCAGIDQREPLSIEEESDES